MSKRKKAESMSPAAKSWRRAFSQFDFWAEHRKFAEEWWALIRGESPRNRSVTDAD